MTVGGRGGKFVVAGGAGAGGHGGAAAGGGDACGACCFEADPEAVRHEERWVYVGEGAGSYSQVANMEMVGAGRGEFEKERYTTVTGWRVRACCVGTTCFLTVIAILLPIAWANDWWSASIGWDVGNECVGIDALAMMEAMDQHSVMFRQNCCLQGYTNFCGQAPHTPAPEKLVVHDKYYTQVKNVHVPHMVPVPIPPPPRQVITHKVMVHTHPYNCDSGVNDFMHIWTRDKQRYCCYKRMIGCHTKVTYRPHYHTITHIKHVTVPVHVPIPAPPAKVINHVVNVPVHDPPKVIKVPVPGHPHVVPKYIHKKRYVPVPEPSPPTYHKIPVPVPVKEPGKVIKVPVPLPAQTIVKNKVIYRTRHVKMLHIYDCGAGFSNWQQGWSHAKKSWCCSHKNKGCPGDHSGQLTKTIVTHVTQHEGPAYYTHHHGYSGHHYYSTHYDHGYTGYTTHHYGAHYGDGTHYGDGIHDGTHVVHVHHYHYHPSSTSTVHYSEDSADSEDSDLPGRRLQEESASEAPVEGGEGSIEGGGEMVGPDGIEGGGEIVGPDGIEGGGEIVGPDGTEDGGEIVGPDGIEGGGDFEGGHHSGIHFTWHHGHYGHYNHAGTWVDSKFPYDAWYGHHYGHYDHSGSFVSSSYPHDAWVGGHWGHYDHSGAWIEVHHPSGSMAYHDAWIHQDGADHYGHYDHHGGWVEAHHPAEGSSLYHDAWIHGHYGHYDHGHWISVHPGHAYHDAWVHGHYGHYDHHGAWVSVHPGKIYHVHDKTHVIYAHPKHIIEKNFYSVKTKTHVVHDPVHIPGPTIHKTLTEPAEPLYNCFSGYHNWKTLWTPDQKKYCCYKFSRACQSKTIQHVRYHTVVQNKNVPVPVPKPIPIHLPPPAPEVIKVPVHLPPPPRKVVKVPYPVPGTPPEPKVITKVIKYNKRVPVPVVVHKTEKIPVPVKRTKIVKVKVPVPSPPKIVYKKVKVMSHPYDCKEGLHSWQDVWSHSKRLYCCWKTKVGCPHSHTVYHTKTIYHTKIVPRKVHLPPKIIYKDITIHQKLAIDCNSGKSNWYYGWSTYKKTYCCDKAKIGCPGTWHGFMHGHGEFHMEHVGHATGHIYDCKAGFSNWLHGWSDSKKTWCCDKEQRGCVKFHCDHKDVGSWSSDKRDWCCGNFQKGCAATTLSPKGCATDCIVNGESRTCQERIDWASKHKFGVHENACELAYSSIQVECDVCRSCSVQAAGCTVHAVAQDPYDCNAALNNFFRAWSPPKKQWCCSNRGKGCEGNSPPSVDPGAGMVWKHVQVNGFWTWVVAGAAGGGGAMPPSLPYACNVGVVNWKIGWSSPKKAWCCKHNKVGCPGQAGGDGGASSHVTVHYSHGGTAAGGAAGGAAGASGSWSSSWHSSGGHVTEVHHEYHTVHHDRRLGGFDCAAGRASRAYWPQEKKDYCCKQDSGLCDK